MNEVMSFEKKQKTKKKNLCSDVIEFIVSNQCSDDTFHFAPLHVLFYMAVL
jgi:hypothetical protein